MTARAPSVRLRMVTVSATYGCRGTLVAAQLANRFDLPFADRLIPPRGSTDMPSAEESLTREERDQVRGRRLLDRLVLLAPGLNMPTPDAADLRDQLRDRVAASIRILVEQGGEQVADARAAVSTLTIPDNIRPEPAWRAKVQQLLAN